jgi:hypothetical protein
MDDDRKIRFVVAPLLFIASVLWGAWFDPGWHKSLTAMFDPSYESSKWFGQAVGLVAGGGLAIFAGGYVIGTLTVFVLWLCFMLRYRLCRGKKSLFHEVALPAGVVAP